MCGDGRSNQTARAGEDASSTRADAAPQTANDSTTTESTALRVRHEWGGTSDVSTTVTNAVMEAADAAGTDLPPIQHSVDLDAIDALFTLDGAEPSTDGHVTFTHAGFEVTVHSTGLVTVFDADDPV